eukprot:TRINITY_DN9784_c0_g3_i2.p1 TRINITY_DN9784_c0_g3~~TRINITY_DN9784_c0_g3_i2.p1  ORF type:complete len:672 (-),score=80.50 TRINITY_DN9784_c0_g3_i2:478-2493(-)
MFSRVTKSLLQQELQFVKKAWQSSKVGSGSSRIARLLQNTDQELGQQPQQAQRPLYQRGRQGNYDRGPFRGNVQINRNASQEVIGLQEQMNIDITSGNAHNALQRFKKFVERAQIEAGQQPDGEIPQKYKLNTGAFEIYFQAIKQSSKLESRIKTMTEGFKSLEDFKLQPTVRLYNQLLALLETHGRGEEALNVLKNNLQKAGLVDFESYKHTILALMRSNQLKKAKDLLLQLHSMTSIVKTQQIAEFRSLHFSLATKALQIGHQDVAVELINLIEDRIPELGRLLRNAPAQVLQPPPYLYAFLLGPAAENGRDDIVTRALLRLGHQSVNIGSNAYPLKIDQGSLLAALNFAARKQDTHTAEQAFQLLQKGLERGYFLNEKGTKRSEGRKPHVATYQALIHTYASVKNWTSMFDAMEKLQNDHSDEVFVSPFGALKDVVSMLAQSTDVTDEVYFTVEQRLNNKKQIYPCMLNFVLAACAQCKTQEPESSDLHPINRTFATFEEFPKFDCIANIDSYNCLMDVCRIYRKREVISSILDQMKKGEVQKNETTFEILFQVFVNAKDLQGMQTVLNDMKRFNFVPSTRLLFSALEKCVDMGAIDIEREIRKELTIMGVNQLPVLEPKLQQNQNRGQNQSQNQYSKQQRPRRDNNRRQEYQQQNYKSKGFRNEQVG